MTWVLEKILKQRENVSYCKKIGPHFTAICFAW